MSSSLEEKLAERTVELSQLKAQLRQEIEARQRAEKALSESNNILQAIFDNIPMMLGFYDSTGQIKFANRLLEETFGWSTEELQTLDILVACYPNPTARQQVLDWILNPSTGWKEFKTQVRDGRVVDISWMNVRLGDGTCISIGQDITEQKRIEKTLQASIKELADIKLALDKAAIVAITDHQGTINYVNDQFCQISQYSREELLGKNHRLINSGSHSRKFFQQMWETISRGQVWQGQIKNRAKDGTYYWMDTTIVPFLNSQGKPYQYVAIRHDITESKQAEALLKQTQEALSQANEELELRVQERTADLTRSNQELEKFAYVASHDLQEPLRKISSFTKLLAEDYQGQLDAEADEYITYIINGTVRMQKLINDLLAYSRVGQERLRKESIELDSLVARVLEDLSMTIEENNAAITVSSLPTIQANPREMVQLFQNLISNGIKFHGEATPRIHIEAQLQSEQWLISVRDNGIGIKPQFAERIFGIFQRLHNRGEYTGTGIGLAICRKIVERHGGKIWVESELGQGATFYFTTPYA